jgi:hypothetical protein
MTPARTVADPPPDDNADAVALRLIKIAADILRTEDQKLGPDWLAQLLDVDGDVLTTDRAAFVLDCHADTARKRAVDAMVAGKPIGVLMAGAVWLFSLRRLLDAIEEDKGRPARLAAATRADKARNFLSRPKVSAQKPIATEPDPSRAALERRM